MIFHQYVCLYFCRTDISDYSVLFSLLFLVSDVFSANSCVFSDIASGAKPATPLAFLPSICSLCPIHVLYVTNNSANDATNFGLCGKPLVFLFLCCIL